MPKACRNGVFVSQPIEQFAQQICLRIGVVAIKPSRWACLFTPEVTRLLGKSITTAS
jgi:hypothetical protein